MVTDEVANARRRRGHQRRERTEGHTENAGLLMARMFIERHQRLEAKGKLSDRGRIKAHLRKRT